MKAMTIANVTFLAMVVGLIVLIAMPNSFLRNLKADTFLNSIIHNSTFMNGLIPIVWIWVQWNMIKNTNKETM